MYDMWRGGDKRQNLHLSSTKEFMISSTLTDAQLLTLGNPAIALLFALSFWWLWAFHNRSGYLLLLAAALICYAGGVTARIFLIPHNSGLNVITTGVLYIASVLLLVEGILRRSHRRLGYLLHTLIVTTIIGALWYFYYISDQLLIRIYILNFGSGIALLCAVPKLMVLRRGQHIDQVLFWVFLIFALSFFLRTALWMPESAGNDLHEFSSSNFWFSLQLTLLVFSALLTTILLIATMSDKIDSLRLERDFDPLTRLLNRRGFQDRVKARLGSINQELVGALACDIDNFKRINDTYGHAAGDEVLIEFGSIIRRAIRSSDIAGRTGGEEFIILLPGTDPSGASELAERLRIALMKAHFSHLPASDSVTASFGVAVLRPGESLDELMERADAWLYAAKDAGRNRVMQGAEYDAATAGGTP